MRKFLRRVARPIRRFATTFKKGRAFFEEGFVQEYNPVVDVLWVVDNSGSMSSALNAVQQNFEAFINEFILLNLDYRMTVITTDMDNPDQSGKRQGPIFNSSMSTSDVISQFLVSVNQGASGSGSERGFEAVQTALTEPLLSGENAGFLRDEAALTVIVVSDEDDDSRPGRTCRSGSTTRRGSRGCNLP